MSVRKSVFRSTMLALAALAAFASSAGAATQVGQACEVGSSGPFTMIQTGVSSGPSYTAPTPGVLTSWGVNTSTWGGSSMIAAVFGEFSGGFWNVVRETPFQTTTANAANSYPARLPVSAGDTLGMIAYNSNSLMCGGFGAGDTIAGSGAFIRAGDSFMPGPIAGARVGVWGVVEADVDSDGFGDETQDKCPQSATFQNACPVLAVSQALAAVKGAISITGTASVDASLIATASVKVPKLGKKQATTVTFSSPPTAFAAGQFTKLKLKLPSRVKSALAGLKKSKKLKVTVTLSGNGIANTATSVKSISLRGAKKK